VLILLARTSVAWSGMVTTGQKMNQLACAGDGAMGVCRANTRPRACPPRSSPCLARSLWGVGPLERSSRHQMSNQMHSLELSDAQTDGLSILGTHTRTEGGGGSSSAETKPLFRGRKRSHLDAVGMEEPEAELIGTSTFWLPESGLTHYGKMLREHAALKLRVLQLELSLKERQASTHRTDAAATHTEDQCALVVQCGDTGTEGGLDAPEIVLGTIGPQLVRQPPLSITRARRSTRGASERSAAAKEEEAASEQQVPAVCTPTKNEHSSAPASAAALPSSTTNCGRQDTVTVARILELGRGGASVADIDVTLHREGYKTSTGTRWPSKNDGRVVVRVLLKHGVAAVVAEGDEKLAGYAKEYAAKHAPQLLPPRHEPAASQDTLVEKRRQVLRKSAAASKQQLSGRRPLQTRSSSDAQSDGGRLCDEQEHAGSSSDVHVHVEKARHRIRRSREAWRAALQEEGGHL
jgi:hypothetical protein